MNQKLLRTISYVDQNLKYFHMVAAFHLLWLITSLTVSARLIPFHISIFNCDILLTAGTWTIPFVFFMQDIITEVYGSRKSREVLFLSLFMVMLYIGYLQLTTFFPIPNTPNIDASYNNVFNALPRHLFALLTSITIGILSNNFILSKLKIMLNGRYLPLRFIVSTAIGEALLQIVGTTIAWFGSLKFNTEILPFVMFSYLYKIAFEAFMTPINIIVCKKLKRAEGIDIYGA